MLSLLLACATPSPEGVSQTPAQPSEAPSPEAAPESDLARALYALGPQGAAARTLLWMQEMGFSPDQSAAFCAHSAQVHQLWQGQEAHGQDLAHQAALAPTLAELEQALLAGPLSQAEQTAYAQALHAAGPPPLQGRADAVRQSLQIATQLWPSLGPEQQSRVGSGLFLLRALDRGQASTPPALPEPWQDGDFSTLRRSTPQPELGIAGLFALEDGDPVSALSTTDRQIVLAMVLAHPGSPSACEAMARPPAP